MSETTLQTVVGLEIHVQLKTKSKLFCGCSTQFGSPPNTQTCPVCTGSPGALPVLNENALRLAIRTGLALGCDIASITRWDRKNYFYPDLPKGYQISQLHQPICGPGNLHIADIENNLPEFCVRIERAHLEEDAGKSIHDEAAGVADSQIDLNRTGTPLLEIVTLPDIGSGQQAKAFLTELKLILSNLEVSDCNMQEGSLRVDANVNVRISDRGQQPVATPIVEVKNLNSFRAVERAIEFEAERQHQKWLNDGLTLGQAPKQTRGWDDHSGATIAQREKEEAADYRYFPDPDLIEMHVSPESIAEIAATLPPLPAKQRQQLVDLGLPPYDANVLANQGQPLIQFFNAIQTIVAAPKLVSNWIQQEVLRILKESNSTIATFPVTAKQLGNLLVDVRDGKIANSLAKDVFQEMISSQCDHATAMLNLGIETVNQSDLEALCQQIISENPGPVAEIRQGNAKAIGALIGKARSLNSNVNPVDVRNCLQQLINEIP